MKSSDWVKKGLILGQALFLLGLIVWFAFSLSAFLPLSRFHFDVSYIGQGEALRHGAHSANELPSWRMPLGPLLESSAIVHNSPSTAYWGTGAVLVVLLALVFSLGASLGPLWCGLLAATVWQALLWTWPLGPGFNKQLFFTPFVLAPAGLLIWRARAPSLRLSLLLGLSIGAGLLYRSTLVFFPPLLAAVEFVFLYKRSWKSYAPHAALLCLTPLLFLIPWLRMNRILHGEWVPFERGAANMNIVTGALGTVTGAHGDIRALMDPPPEDGMRSVLGWAAREIARHPGRYLRGVWERLLYAFKLEPWLFILAGAAVLGSWKRLEFRVLGLYCAYWLLITCSMSIENNYFEPLWPLLAALAAAAPLPALPPESRQPWPRVSLAPLIPAAAVCLGLGVWAAIVVASYSLKAQRRSPYSDEALDEASASSPHDAWLLQERGRRRAGRGETRLARADLRLAFRRIPDMASLKLEYAWALAQEGNSAPLTAGRFTLYPRTDFFNEDIRDKVPIYRALMFWRQGRSQKAVRAIDEGLKTFCADQGFLHADIISASEQTLDQMLRRRCESNFLGRIESALWYQKPVADRVFMARDILSRSGKLASPREIFALPYSGLEKLHAGAPPPARKIAAVRLSPAEALKDKGIAAYMAGSPENAVADLREALALDPSLLESYMSLAAVYTASGCRREALDVYDKALEQPGGSTSLLGLIRKSRGELAALGASDRNCRLQRPF